MKLPQTIFLPGAFLLFTACTQKAYFQNPVYANNLLYKTMPTKKEGVRTASYGGMSLGYSNMNDEGRDDAFILSGNLYQTQQGGIVQGYYGVDMHFGVYRVGSYYEQGSYDGNESLDVDLLNAKTGNKLFGTMGGSGGINLVARGKDIEWRYIGIEASIHKEFGSYYRFRKSLHDSAANLIDKQDVFSSLAIYSDFIVEDDRINLGVKLSGGISPRRQLYRNEWKQVSYLTQHFLCATFHGETKKTGFYFQVGWGSDYAEVVRWGLNFRLR
jgi:hypothetical protein